VGGSEESGGILVAEEAFYQSLLELEFQNPEILQVRLKLIMINTYYSTLQIQILWGINAKILQ